MILFYCWLCSELVLGFSKKKRKFFCFEIPVSFSKELDGGKAKPINHIKRKACLPHPNPCAHA